MGDLAEFAAAMAVADKEGEVSAFKAGQLAQFEAYVRDEKLAGTDQKPLADAAVKVASGSGTACSSP